MGRKYDFEELVIKCMEDKAFYNAIIAAPEQYGLTTEELDLLKETDFDMITIQIDERTALTSLGMWGSVI